MDFARAQRAVVLVANDDFISQSLTADNADGADGGTEPDDRSELFDRLTVCYEIGEGPERASKKVTESHSGHSERSEESTF
jgi:hypothetical protein